MEIYVWSKGDRESKLSELERILWSLDTEKGRKEGEGRNTI